VTAPTTEYRVRWRSSRWGPSTSSKSRLFSRVTDAERFAAKLRAQDDDLDIALEKRLVYAGPWGSTQ
jgi:hypothetical protein